MTVLLVLFTFASFLLIDHFRSRHAVVQPALQVAARQEAKAPRLQPALVGGFTVPENSRYHPGHTWALSESPSLVRVGMYDFASKLTGKLESITLPQRGQWIRQGQKMCTIHRDGCTVDLVSPIEGSVSDINEDAGCRKTNEASWTTNRLRRCYPSLGPRTRCRVGCSRGGNSAQQC